jgi:hypothetical protein
MSAVRRGRSPLPDRSGVLGGWKRMATAGATDPTFFLQWSGRGGDVRGHDVTMYGELPAVMVGELWKTLETARVLDMVFRHMSRAEPAGIS